MMLLIAALSSSAPEDVNAIAAAKAELYDEICLRAFPDDQAVESAAKAHGATAMSPEDVKITLRDDPGRAWTLADDSATIWLELPPYHACSIRWNSTAKPDYGAYRKLADRYERRIGGFTAVDPPYDADIDGIHIHATGEQRRLANGGMESLFIFEQNLTDPARRAAGETGYVLRFVHQLAPPGSN
jgi:hypothetical protein